MSFRLILSFKLLLILALPVSAEASSLFCRMALWFTPQTLKSEYLSVATFGPEFTFSNYDLSDEEKSSNYPLRAKVHQQALEAYKRLCKKRKDCRIELGSDKHGGNFQVVYHDGWYFQVGIDEGVLEVQTKKGTYFDFELQKERLQEDLFDKMSELGLHPMTRLGGGHIHLGSDIFHKNPVLFRNFFADYANFPQVPFGALDVEDPNHPPIVVLKEHQQKGFISALKEFDAIEKPLLKNFIWLIHSQVYTEAYTPEWGGGSYYQSLRLERMYWPNGMNTVEIRGFRPQRSVEEFLLEIKLIAFRLDYLNARQERVAFRYDDESVNFSGQAVVDAFYTYVTQTGLQWRPYRKLLPDHLKYITPYKQLPWTTKDRSP